MPVLRWILPHADTRDLRWSGFGQMVFGGLSLTLQVGREKRRRAVGQECYFHTSIRVPQVIEPSWETPDFRAIGAGIGSA